MEFKDVINKRRSTRRFLQDSIPDEVLRELIEAASVAPSGGNEQNWYFGIIKDEKTKTKLAKAAGNQEWIATAPVVIACCTELRDDLSKLPQNDFGLVVNKTRFGEDFIEHMNNYPDRKMAGVFWNNANPLIPGEHIFLAAVNRGLSGCWIGYLDVLEASEILNLPNEIVCLFLMPIGYPKEPFKVIERKSYGEMTFHERWNNKG